MRSKLSAFVTLIVVAMLCTVVFASVAQKGSVPLLASKYGHSVETAAPVTAALPANLPPVSTRTGRGLDEIIISEDFEAIEVGQLPLGWTQVDVDQGSTVDPAVPGLSVWQVYAQTGLPAHSGTHMCGNHYNDGALPNDDWLILPQQVLGGPISLSYWIATHQAAYPESYEVRVSTGGNQPADFTDLIYDGNNIPTAYTQHTHDLSAYDSTPIWIAFHYNSIDEFVIKLDDVILEGTQLAAFGTLSGTVTNENSGTPVAGATVTVVGASLSVQTNASGQYSIPNIPANTYDVQFAHPLYTSETSNGVVITANETTTLNAALVQVYDSDDFASTASPVDIPDVDTAYMNMSVDEDILIADLDVTINITHTWDSDVWVWLQSPWNQRVLLTGNIGPQGAGYTDTRFDDEAITPIASGTPPYTGSFQPMEQLVAFDAFTTSGTWTLVAYDDEAQDVGTIQNFTLHVTYELAADDPNTPLPTAFAFSGNYPNPFNASTQFMFDMSRAGHASLVLYNITGQEIATLVDGNVDAGHHLISYTAAALPSGLYFARFTAPDFSTTRKVILMK